jgi:hypothetical protein
MQDDDEAPGPLEKIRASICEIAELYALKYSEDFKQLGSFVNGVWTMLTTAGPSGKEDLASRPLLDTGARTNGAAGIESSKVPLRHCQDGKPSRHVRRARYT